MSIVAAPTSCVTPPWPGGRLHHRLRPHRPGRPHQAVRLVRTSARLWSVCRGRCAVSVCCVGVLCKWMCLPAAPSSQAGTSVPCWARFPPVRPAILIELPLRGRVPTPSACFPRAFRVLSAFRVPPTDCALTWPCLAHLTVVLPPFDGHCLALQVVHRVRDLHGTPGVPGAAVELQRAMTSTSVCPGSPRSRPLTAPPPRRSM